jgi:hypothetical protein
VKPSEKTPGPEQEQDPDRVEAQKERGLERFFDALENTRVDDENGNRIFAMPKLHVLTRVAHDLEGRVLGYEDATGTVFRPDRAEDFSWAVRGANGEPLRLHFVDSEEPATVVKGESHTRTLSTSPSGVGEKNPLDLVPWVLGVEFNFDFDTPSNPFIRVLD